MAVTERQNALTDVIQAINSTLDADEILRIVMDNIIRLVKAERGFLMLRNDKADYTIRVARNWEQETLTQTEAAISRSVIRRVVKSGEPVLTTNAKEDPRFGAEESIIVHNLRSILCAPLKVKGSLIGVIYLDNRIHVGIFTEAERDLLTTFADHAAVAIDNARMFAEVNRTLAEVTALKNLMDNVFASIASGVITADDQSRITLANQAARRILGDESLDLRDLPLEAALAALIGAANAAELSRDVQQVKAGGRLVVGREYAFAHPQRGPLTVSLNLAPLKDAAQATQGVAIVLDDLTEKKRLEKQRRLFERMVSPAVIGQLDLDHLQLGGDRAQITTLFADIRGYTWFSELLDPVALVGVLNRYLGIAADAVLAEAGTIDKFLGDAIMAWFNAPIPQPDHTLRAVRAALAMRAGVQRLSEQMPPEYRLQFGAGIHTGDAVLGLIGTEKRVEYTAIGDAVNTAKRIQESASGGQILISAEAYQLVEREVAANPLAPVEAKGKRIPMEVFEVVGLR